MQHKHPVILLYVHPMLGQRITRHVQSETGVEVRAVSALDIEAINAAIEGDPRVIIYERSRVLESLDLAKLAPHAVLIDVTDTIGLGPGQRAALGPA